VVQTLVRAFDRSATVSAVALIRGRPLDDLMALLALDERDRQPLS
jgi:hypothetical protein